MREILFKGKTIDSDDWVFGGYSQYDVKYDILTDTFEKIERHCVIDYNGECLWRDVIPESVSEFTGLTDKNGKKSFEGDIVKIELLGGFEIGHITYSETGCRFKFADRYGSTYGFDDTCTFEVIGNIHDNPELLEGDKSDA